MLFFRRTGIVYNVTARAVGVIVYKVVGNRYMEKRVNLRVEHVKHSKCRDDFLNRVKKNAELKKEAKAAGSELALHLASLFPLANVIADSSPSPITPLLPISFRCPQAIPSCSPRVANRFDREQCSSDPRSHRLRYALPPAPFSHVHPRSLLYACTDQCSSPAFSFLRRHHHLICSRVDYD